MKKILSIALGVVILASCSTSNEVVSNKLFQKRKYKKGWHLNTAPKLDKTTKGNSEQVAFNNSNETISKEVVADSKKEELTVELETVESNFSLIENNKKAEEKVSVSTQKASNKRIARSLNKVKKATQSISNNAVFEAVSEMKTAPILKAKIEKESKSKNSSGDDMLILLYILAVIIPFVAVGIATDWDIKKVLINLLLSILCYIPGVIHAFIIIRDYYR